MATRDKTNIFLKERSIASETNKTFSNIEIQNTQTDFMPDYMHTASLVKNKITQIKSQLKELNETYKNQLLPRFRTNLNTPLNGESIDRIIKNTTKVFMEAKKQLEKMKSADVSPQESLVLQNISKNFAHQLQELSLEFINLQAQYENNLDRQEQKNKNFMVSVNTEKVYQDFNEDESKREFLFLEDRNKLIDERTQNISNIAKNVQELAQCFQDLSHLITYQGTILDRIDYNVEQTDHNVQIAVDIQEDIYQKTNNNKNKICMILLFIALIFMLIVVIIKAIRNAN